ncbi:MAG: hypothetical protein WEC33_00380, partial [Dehalococcoidia bacterium]
TIGGVDMEQPGGEGPARRWSRRRLMGAAAGGAALQAAGLIGWPASASAATTVKYSVGYLPGSARLPAAACQLWCRADLPELQVVPASQAPADGKFAAPGTVEVRLHGLYPGIAPSGLATSSRLAVTVLYPGATAKVQPLPYYAWQGRLSPRPAGSAPVRFPVPLRKDGNFDLLIEAFGPGSSAPLATLTAAFSATDASRRARLRPGVYVLGLTPTVFNSARTLAGGLTDGETSADPSALVVSFAKV